MRRLSMLFRFLPKCRTERSQGYCSVLIRDDVMMLQGKGPHLLQKLLSNSRNFWRKSRKRYIVVRWKTFAAQYLGTFCGKVRKYQIVHLVWIVLQIV